MLKGNWVVSIGDLCKFLAKEAENLGVEIFCGFPVVDVVKEKNRIVGVLTNSKGLNKNGEKKPTFEEGVEIRAKMTVLAEGSRGLLTVRLKDAYDLVGKAQQMYSLGIKETWKLNEGTLPQGYIAHTAGFPLSSNSFGGGFMYMGADNILHLGLIVGLNYKNPYLSPYEEFQRFKNHPHIAKILEKGQRIGYGARVLEEGGYYALPKSFGVDGLILAGSNAGLLDFSKIKGVHNALKSGKIAAESIFSNNDKIAKIKEIPARYTDKIKDSPVYRDLKRLRGYTGIFLKHIWLGYIFSFLSSYEPGRKIMNWQKYRKLSKCCDDTEPAAQHKKITYPPHDNKISFDIDKSLALSGVHHEYDQPCHLRIIGDKEAYEKYSVQEFDKMEERFCPAKVFEFNNGELKFNAQNCLHCKTCTIKVFFKIG